ncbi:BTAD domain-containing putative transcriptional regulator [Actinoplanes philippinensis]|uniref:BTAD domain-containing putative transcriptional regulator n=1 Tax=Actinoplanes philippinensis TaxID=35752 RepID=UPI0035A25090
MLATAGGTEAARAAYREALDLWRGPACAEIDAPAEFRQARDVLRWWPSWTGWPVAARRPWRCTSRR